MKQLHVERERYEEAMKKAFMRGVCALNMEAMNIFHEEDARGMLSPSIDIVNVLAVGYYNIIIGFL